MKTLYSCRQSTYPQKQPETAPRRKIAVATQAIGMIMSTYLPEAKSHHTLKIQAPERWQGCTLRFCGLGDRMWCENFRGIVRSRALR